MPRKAKTSRLLEKTERRMLGLQSIHPDLDFGDSISLSHLSELTTQLNQQLVEYNLMLHDLDSTKETIETLEKTIRDISERLVNGVASKYGKDSREYEMAGGVRKSDRIRRATIARLKASSETAIPSAT